MKLLLRSRQRRNSSFNTLRSRSSLWLINLVRLTQFLEWMKMEHSLGRCQGFDLRVDWNCTSMKWSLNVQRTASYSTQQF
ncbi:hypothetical protein Y032_0508g2705 [Ancylostoma ceylanicum]|nr:hypothetical protein Y032_0508g2705 [Ancylostoma ceylanicum]